MISVIIPTFNRRQALRRCLSSLESLAGSAALEVIVVDDGGRVRLDDIERRGPTGSPSLRLVRQDHAGPAAARNRGARAATGDPLVFLDDDCIVDPHWMARLRSLHRRHPGAAIGGGTVNALPDDRYASCHQLILDRLLDHLNLEPEAALLCTSNNLLVPAEAFHRIGGFDPGFAFAAAEDRDFCDRWRESGGQLVYAPQAFVRHGHAMTMAAFWRQHFRYGRGARRLHELRRARGQSRGALPWRLHRELLAGTLRPERRGQRAALLSLFALSQIATACGYLLERSAPARAGVAGDAGAMVETYPTGELSSHRDGGCPDGSLAR